MQMISGRSCRLVLAVPLLLALSGQATVAPDLFPKGSLLYVPNGSTGDGPLALIVALHGAGGNARSALQLFRRHADRRHFVIYAPKSAGPTWDLVRDGRFGEDLRHIEAGLKQIFAQHSIDRRRVTIAGFSDGASYALTLGTAKGSPFGRVVAFSPGFLARDRLDGTAKVFISHGRDDRVLPIARTSRQIVPRIRAAGQAVRYVEYRGGHLVPPAIVRQAIEWLGENQPDRPSP